LTTAKGSIARSQKQLRLKNSANVHKTGQHVTGQHVETDQRSSTGEKGIRWTALAELKVARGARGVGKRSQPRSDVRLELQEIIPVLKAPTAKHQMILTALKLMDIVICKNHFPSCVSAIHPAYSWLTF
jgi:hypothetical protein